MTEGWYNAAPVAQRFAPTAEQGANSAKAGTSSTDISAVVTSECDISMTHQAAKKDSAAEQAFDTMYAGQKRRPVAFVSYSWAMPQYYSASQNPIR